MVKMRLRRERSDSRCRGRLGHWGRPRERGTGIVGEWVSGEGGEGAHLSCFLP